MLAPRLMPAQTMSAMSPRRPVTARWTQPVGVPFTKRNPFADSRTDRGRSRVREFEAPLWSRSGATTVIVPRSASAFARTARPGAKYPSSLLSRIRIYLVSLLINKEKPRPRPPGAIECPVSAGFYSKRCRYAGETAGLDAGGVVRTSAGVGFYTEPGPAQAIGPQALSAFPGSFRGSFVQKNQPGTP